MSKFTFFARQKVQDLIVACKKVQINLFLRAKSPRFNRIARKKVQIYLLCAPKSPRFCRVASKKVQIYIFTREEVKDLIELRVNGPNFYSVRAKKSKI